MSDDYDKLEEEAQKKLKPQKPKMKISGKSAFLLSKLSKEGGESQKEDDQEISKND
ncbi:MAG: hypothetical protein PHW75_02355 [Patescibacteria group bacterium]|nr:hypothetical protein [Patescibacteria group bacterium]